MKFKKLYYVLSLLVMFSMLLAACAPAATQTEEPMMEETEEPMAEPEPTEEPAMEEEPAAPMTERHGGWLDEVVVSVVAGDSVISQLQAGTIDFFSFNLASDVYPAIKEAGLPSTQSLGGYYGVSF